MFYTPRRVAQLVISAGLRRSGYTYESFVERYTQMVDIFGRTCLEADINDQAVSPLISSVTAT